VAPASSFAATSLTPVINAQANPFLKANCKYSVVRLEFKPLLPDRSSIQGAARRLVHGATVRVRRVEAKASPRGAKGVAI
jgi:hypothetical protein